MRRSAQAGSARLVPPLEWQASYDVASVDRILSWLESDRADLQRQIFEARVRAQRARAAGAHRETAEAGLRARIAAWRRELDATERPHRAAIDAIHAAAGNDAARLIAAARREADAMRAAATAALAPGERERAAP